MKSGGYIVINQTEALVAIDVNTGKFVGKSNRLEDTIVKTNLEAAKEIVRQIRLRDLGGIIVLDFIDMEERKNRAKVMGALEQELRSDCSPSKILQFNDFGLVAITRKRVKQSLERTLCTPCPYCGGGGMVKPADGQLRNPGRGAPHFERRRPPQRGYPTRQPGGGQGAARPRTRRSRGDRGLPGRPGHYKERPDCASGTVRHRAGLMKPRIEDRGSRIALSVWYSIFDPQSSIPIRSSILNPLSSIFHPLLYPLSF